MYYRTIPAVMAVVLISVPTHHAAAWSLPVELACASDYYAYCSQYDSDSPAVRKCMNAHGEKLSAGCVKALVVAGEVSKAEVDRRTKK